MAVHCHKLRELKNECTSHNSIILAIRVPKIIIYGGDLMKFWEKQVRKFSLAHPVYSIYNKKADAFTL